MRQPSRAPDRALARSPSPGPGATRARRRGADSNNVPVVNVLDEPGIMTQSVLAIGWLIIASRCASLAPSPRRAQV